MERKVPRNSMRSNPVKMPAMRSWYRVTNRSIGRLLRDVWLHIHHRRIPMGRFSFYDAAAITSDLVAAGGCVVFFLSLRAFVIVCTEIAVTRQPAPWQR